jgi:hypothetical protein
LAYAFVNVLVAVPSVTCLGLISPPGVAFTFIFVKQVQAIAVVTIHTDALVNVVLTVGALKPTIAVANVPVDLVRAASTVRAGLVYAFVNVRRAWP